MRLIDIPTVIVGAVLVVLPLDAALRSFILPRGVPVSLSRLIVRMVRIVFDLIARPARDYEARDRVMALYGPVALLALPAVFMIFIFVGFACFFQGFDGTGWGDAFITSGSSLFTLGFLRPPHYALNFLAFLESGLGLTLLALLISYLPTIYSAFSRREIAVTGLAVRAGTPPTAWDLLERAHRARFLDQLDQTWEVWELWFQELSETHTSLSILAFFRSPNPNRSWVTASGAVLDAAALRYALVDIPWTPAPGLCIRSGYLALREIADFYGIEYDPDPPPDAPISITRDEFEQVYQRLAAAGVPVRTDRDRSWKEFTGWRVNYDRVLTALAGLVMAPYAPWSSDRSSRYRAPPLHPRRGRPAGQR
ncbi:MAG: hypothetical protein JWL83_652 [Actinomycetia bacterium]|nr:hypothetical protein [Actinomycetes bacterium]